MALGADARATLETFSFLVELAGTWDGQRLVLRGTRPAVNSRDCVGAVNAEVTLLPGMRGHVQYEMRPTCQWAVDAGATRVVQGGPLTFTSRTPLIPLPADHRFAGTFAGRWIWGACAPVGEGRCFAEDEGDIQTLRLTLQQTGMTVSGTVGIASTTIPVSGTVSGHVLTLAGSVSTLVSGGRSHTELQSFVLVADKIGRLSGSFTLVTRVVYDSGRVLGTARAGTLTDVSRSILTP